MQTKRTEVSDEFKWKISDLFDSDEQFENSFQIATAEIDKFEPLRDSFLDSSQNLYSCLQKRDDITLAIERLYSYSHLKLDEDSTNSLYQKLADRCNGLFTKYSSAVSFIEPMILSFDENKLKSYFKENSDLQLYTHYLENLLREKKHILTPELEELLAEVGEIGQAPRDIFSMLTNADMKFPLIKDESGKEVELTTGRYISFMENHDRRVRQEAFNAFYDVHISHKSTIASAYNASVKKDVFFSKTRKYDSSIQSSLSNDNIPIAVYKNLIDTVHKFLPLMHRYISLRKKRLGLSELHMYDLYAPIVKDANTKISFEESKKVVLEALKPMGEEYINLLKKGFDEKWIDVYENEGKRSGAYSWGVYDCHPFVLLNFDNKINDMFTLAHEMGHALHSYYSSKNQNYIYSNYTIFLAEVASTVNESLLMEYLLKTETDKTKKDYLLNYYLEQFRGTLFRQTMFAEFEMITHEMVERGEPLTSESLCKLYRELNIKYYGSDIVIDDKIDYEWSRIPHFYRAFYVYQYATGYSSAIAISKNILENKNFKDSYIEMLKSGANDYSINILKKAGVDMTSPKPIEDALKVFDKVLTQMENL